MRRNVVFNLYQNQDHSKVVRERFRKKLWELHETGKLISYKLRKEHVGQLTQAEVVELERELTQVQKSYKHVQHILAKLM
jgi:hypothetical protein